MNKNVPEPPRQTEEILIINNYYTLNSLSLFWLAESVQLIFEIRTRVKVTGNHVKVMGNHVVYDHGAWFLRVIMSSLLALFFLPSVKKHKQVFFFCSVQCIIKQLLDSVFVISRIIKVSVRVIILSLRPRLITHTSTLIILDITKTSSNNCLLSSHWLRRVSSHCKLQILLSSLLD